MTELVPANDATLATIDQKIFYSQTISASNLLPEAYRGRPENVLIAVETGAALGIPAIQALNSINVIKGKAAMSSDLMASLVRRAGHKLRIRQDGMSVTAELVRADDPDFTFTVTWDKAKATTAGLWGKGNWATYPDQMLRARAITEVCRQGASDALMGVIYTPEELTEPAPQARPAKTGNSLRDRMPTTRPEPEPEPAPSEEGATEAQIKKIMATFNEIAYLRGIEVTRKNRLDAYTQWTGRPVTSTSVLTKSEAAHVIDRLDSWAADLQAAAEQSDGELVQAELIDEEVQS